MTSIATLQRWFELGVYNDESYMIVICDTYDHTDFPVYYEDAEACLDRIDNPGDMARVMEVYNLSRDMQEQLDEHRAWHPPSRFTTQPKMDAKVLAEMEGDFDVSAGGFNSLENLYSGKTVVMPVDAFHAKAMISIGMKYLEDNGHQHTPTQEAYDAACKALWKHRDRADRAEKIIDRVKWLVSEGETDQSVLLETLDTPESGLCDVCGGEGRRAFPNANNTIVHHPFCTACKGTGKAPHTPEQAHGDALAALNRIRQAIECPVQYAEETARDFAIVRRHLTASGVPYPINVVFDGPPSATSGRFVEVETDDGSSVRVGEWIERQDGLWALRINCSGVPFGPTQEMVDSGMRWLSAADGRHVVESIWKDMYTTYLARSNHES